MVATRSTISYIKKTIISMKKTIATLLLLFIVAISYAKSPKYIFYFIGDGMGLAHIQTAQAALAAKKGEIGFEKLEFTQFPYSSMVSTYCTTKLITDSAAAGTALASGEKTSVGTIGMNSTHTYNLISVAVEAKNSGMKVALLTTVSIDHATPAAFYAHQPSRNQYKEIADWLPKAGFDLYAGAGLLKISPTYYDSITKNCGYKVVRGKDAELKAEKIVWIEKEGKKASKLALAIDRTDDDMTLAEMTEKAIEFLEKDAQKGFFMMVEGGQIDWAAHSNDAASIVHEVIDFDHAIASALEFYEEHPEETLIIVTADHETGGMTLGVGERGYDTKLEILFTQKGSKDIVTEQECARINNIAGVGFTSGSHTAISVPLYAIGVGAEFFNGAIDNTDIAKYISSLIAKNRE